MWEPSVVASWVILGGAAELPGLNCVYLSGAQFSCGHSATAEGQPSQEQAAAAAAKSRQSCPTLCDPIEGSPPGSPIPGILQARALEWGPLPSPPGTRRYRLKGAGLGSESEDGLICW